MARRTPPYEESELRAAVAAASCWSDVLRLLGLVIGGNNNRTVRRYVDLWGVPTDHFDPDVGRRRAGQTRAQPLEELLVEHSTYSRTSLKRRLLASGLKAPECEMCGQGTEWRGRRMSLILDHINGVADDNRLENLRIVCPNCAATLDTHCGRNLERQEPRSCPECGGSFVPSYARHRYCSPRCVGRAHARTKAGVPRPAIRKVERPPYEQLMRELAESSYVAVGRKYGVSDNAVRKWVRWYEEERRRAA